VRRLKYFVSQGANVNAENHVGETPLYLLVLGFDDTDLYAVKFLLSKGADADMTVRRTILEEAKKRSKKGPVIEYLSSITKVTLRPEKTLPDLFPCKITITQGGRPLEDATVQLVPEKDAFDFDFPWYIIGKTDANGTAKIFTHTDHAGAPAGKFKVLVSKIDEESSMRYVKAEYGDLAKTPHSITITRGINEATFDVGEAIRARL